MERITYCIGIRMRGPVAIGSYDVGDCKLEVSYPEHIFDGSQQLQLPVGENTVFTVSWPDKNGRDAARLHSKSFDKFFPVRKALWAINELLLAFKLVRIGHADGSGLRTIGDGDILFDIYQIDSEPPIFSRLGLKLYGRHYNWAEDPNDPHHTTELARPHIATDSYPVARRFVRCFELLEHGFYSEALIVAFFILDDSVQNMLHRRLEKNGVHSEALRDLIIRGIDRDRLSIYLGKLLLLLEGKTIDDLWPHATKALKWLNRTRNDVAHQAVQLDHSAAAKGIFVCINILAVVHNNGLSEVEFPIEMFRHAKLSAAWTEQPPDWVPSGPISESYDFKV